MKTKSTWRFSNVNTAEPPVLPPAGVVVVTVAFPMLGVVVVAFVGIVISDHGSVGVESASVLKSMVAVLSLPATVVVSVITVVVVVVVGVAVFGAK